MFKTIFNNFQLKLSCDALDDESLVTVETVSDLKKIEDMVNHIVEVNSMEICLNNLNKQPAEMVDILTTLAKIQTLNVRNLSI